MDGQVAMSPSLDPSQPASRFQNDQLHRIADLVENLKGIQDTDLVEQRLRQLVAEVQTFRIQLGPQNQDDELLDAFQNPILTGTAMAGILFETKLGTAQVTLQRPDSRRRSSLAYEGDTHNAVHLTQPRSNASRIPGADRFPDT